MQVDSSLTFLIFIQPAPINGLMRYLLMYRWRYFCTKTLYVSEHPYTSHNILLGQAEFKAMSIKAYDLHPDSRVTFGKTLEGLWH